MPDLQQPDLQEEENLDQGQQQEQGGTGNQPGTQPEPNQQEGGGVEISQDPVEEGQQQQPQGGEQQEEQQPVSRRESKRIQQLLDRFAERDKEMFSQQSQSQRPQPRQRGRQIIPEGEYDIEDINGMAAQYGESEYSRGLSEAQAFTNANTFATRLEIDAPRVNSKYTFLDKEADDFNPGVASFVNRMYLNSVGYDPRTGVVQDRDLRYGDFVEGLMEVIDLVSLGRSADTTRNVATQAAQTGIRPGGSGKTVYRGLDPKKMSDEQLDAIIAQQITPR